MTKTLRNTLGAGIPGNIKKQQKNINEQKRVSMEGGNPYILDIKSKVPEFFRVSKEAGEAQSKLDNLVLSQGFYSNAQTVCNRYQLILDDLQKYVLDSPNIQLDANTINAKADAILGTIGNMLNEKYGDKYIFGGANRDSAAANIFVNQSNIDPAGSASGVNYNYISEGFNQSQDTNQVKELWAGNPMFRDAIAACYEMKRLAGVGTFDLNTPEVNRLITSASNSFIGLVSQGGALDTKMKNIVADIGYAENRIEKAESDYEIYVRVDMQEVSIQLQESNQLMQMLRTLYMYMEKAKYPQIGSGA